MRTTIELDEEQRAKLVEMASRRGLKGFSPIVKEALDRYLRSSAAKSPAAKDFLRFRGILTDEEARYARAVAKRLRSSWR